MSHYSITLQYYLRLLFCTFFFRRTAYSALTIPSLPEKVEGDFHGVSNNIRMAIIGKGINIAHVLPASNMLNRTGPAYGYQTDTYKHARTYEFCSARISHKLARQNPDNIVLAPVTTTKKPVY